ncbi:MAG: cell surface protein, partial [Bacteroidetes bacterium]|nr:cell surface protein [Bacteroidota bacterium]
MRSVICFFLLITLSSLGQVNCNYWSTYLGKTGTDDIKGIAVDNNKNSYVILQTDSPTLPVTAGLISTTLSGSYDAYFAKFDSCGVFQWGTYLGTPGFDSGEKIIVCNDGNIAFTGYSQAAGLPTTTACFQPSHAGQTDCFIGKMTPGGTLIWLTYFGKNGSDLAYDISSDFNNNLYIGGTTTSNSLYVTASSFQPAFGGNTDAFIAKFSSAGNFKWSTYYGGSGSEDIHALTNDVNGNVFGSGGTFSFNLFTTSGCLQPSKDAGMDCYILKLDSTGTGVFATYLGGDSQDDAFGLAADNSGNLYVSGQTASTNFTTTAGAGQTSLSGMSDIYFTKLSSSGALLYSSYLGGTDNEFVSRMKYYNNALYLFGTTGSSNTPMYGASNFSVLPGVQSLFIYRIGTSGLPDFSTYYGSPGGTEYAGDLAVKNNWLYFGGRSSSSGYPVTSGCHQQTYDSNDDGILTRLPIGSSGMVTGVKESASEKSMIFPNPARNAISFSKEHE